MEKMKAIKYIVSEGELWALAAYKREVWDWALMGQLHKVLLGVLATAVPFNTTFQED